MDHFIEDLLRLAIARLCMRDLALPVRIYFAFDVRFFLLFLARAAANINVACSITEN